MQKLVKGIKSMNDSIQDQTRNEDKMRGYERGADIPIKIDMHVVVTGLGQSLSPSNFESPVIKKTLSTDQV